MHVWMYVVFEHFRVYREHLYVLLLLFNLSLIPYYYRNNIHTYTPTSKEAAEQDKTWSAAAWMPGLSG